MQDQDTERTAEQAATKPDIGPFPGKMCYSTAKAVEALKQGKPGDSFTRAAMAKIIERSCEVQTLGYGNVNSAIRHVETHHGIVWRWSKPDQAWVCLGPVECVDESRATIRQARKRARRAMTVAKTVDVKQLDPDERREHSLNVAISGMMIGTSSSHFRKQLAEHPRIGQPDTRKMLTLFGSNGNAGDSGEKDGDKG